MDIKLLDFIAPCSLYSFVGVGVLLIGPWIVTEGVTFGQLIEELKQLHEQMVEGDTTIGGAR